MVNFIVSGCPRSGTSLTMNIIAKSGLPIAADNKRAADYDNKKGYFEVDQIINKIKDDPQGIFKFDGKVVKIIHYGLQFLPKGDYKIIYVERDLDEVLASMEKMMGKSDPNRAETKRIFSGFNEKIKKMIQERKDVDVLFIKYNDLLTTPEPVVDELIKFLGINLSKKQAMLSVIDPSLYRNRKI